TGPYPPDLSTASRLRGFKHQFTHRLHLLTLLDKPAPSGSSGTTRLRRGRLPPSPTFPGSVCPQLHQAATTTQRGRSLTTPRPHSASWRTAPPRRKPPHSSRSHWPAAAPRSPSSTPGSRPAPGSSYPTVYRHRPRPDGSTYAASRAIRS